MLWPLTVILSGVAGLIETFEIYVFKDWEFLTSQTILILLDTILGLRIAIKLKRLSSYDFSRLFDKVILYLILMIMAHVMTHYRIEGEPNQIYRWVNYVIYSVITGREAISILENISILWPKFLPKSLTEKFKVSQQQIPKIK